MSKFKIIAVEHKVCQPTMSYKSPDEMLTLIADDGRKVELRLSGDCCSGSYFEKRSLEDAKGLVGQDLLGVEPVESTVVPDEIRIESTEENDYNGGTYRYHGVKLKTNQETIVVDWRNESNGYYDGTCTVVGWTPKSPVDEYDYTFQYGTEEDN